MNGQTLYRGWQQPQARVEGFLGRVFRNDVQRIDYKPLFVTQLLEMPSERYQNESQGMVTIHDSSAEKEEKHE
jgi:hypothetical protein